MAVTGGGPTLGSAPGPRQRFGPDLRPRVAAAVGLGSLALAAAWIGGFVFAAFWWVASVVVLWEWQRLVGAGRLAGRVAVGGLALALASLSALHNSIPAVLAALVFGAVAVGWAAGRRNALWAAAGALYAGALAASLGLIRMSPSFGLAAILWLFAVVWGADIAAYFAGRLIGGPKLWPAVSPGKTWSGAIVGALAGALLGLMLAAWTNRLAALFWLGLATAIVSELGDLFEFRRQTAFRRQGFERPHPRARRTDGSARRVHSGVLLRRRRRGRALEGRFHRERTFSMVIASRAVEALPLRSREGAPAVEAPARPRRLSILGATGSIGRSCAQVIAVAPHRFSVVSVAGGRDGAALAKCAIKLGAEFAALADPAGYSDLKAGLAGFEIEIAAGPEAVKEAALRDADLVVAAIVGAAGSGPTFAAVAEGRTVALANKETLVCAGEAVMATARRSGSTVLPMDSEHNALFQAIGARDPDTIEKMTITASGGPFREWSADRISRATPEEALSHPNWVMGPKVTIDFCGSHEQGIGADRGPLSVRLASGPARRRGAPAIDRARTDRLRRRLVDRRHGLSGHAHPDRPLPRLPRPDRLRGPRARPRRAWPIDLRARRPRALSCARARNRGVARRGGAPTALNGANEIAVAAFLDRRIGFGEIARLVARTLSAMTAAGELGRPPTLRKR